MSSVPDDPTALDTTANSNFAYLDRMDLLERLPQVCTVPAVRRELRAGVDSHPHLQRALDCVGDTIPVAEPGDAVGDTANELEARLDPGEAQAFALADIHGGTLVTDDGPARTLARRTDVPVTGSIGVLMTAVEDGHVTEADADRWLKRWVDETDYRAPSREFADYIG
jgi:predicted nucleic acid-binding protein